jgi:hypothetical protein
MSTLKTHANRRSSRVGGWSSLVVLGLLLAGCQSAPHDPSSSSHAFVTPPPDCDNTVPLNHCGSYMPQNDPNNGS